MRSSYRWYFLLSNVVICLVASLTVAQTQDLTHESTLPSVHPRMAVEPGHVVEYSRKGPELPEIQLDPLLLAPPVDGFDFDSSIPLTGGFLFIPPDPHVAVGADHVVNIGNVIIEWRTKNNPDSLEHRESLQSFFSVLTTGVPLPLGTFTFDPKVIYDQYSGRFVAITLEQTDVLAGDPSDQSRILVAVSKTSDPNGGWWFHAIDSKITIGVPSWGDYPGLAVDDKAVYITNNMFSFFTFGGVRTGTRMWIVNKTPTYSGPDNSIAFTVQDPITPVGGFEMTMQPAHMFGALPLGSGGQPLGTYLVGYSALTQGGPGGLEAMQVIEVTDPLGTPNFTVQFVFVGDIEDVGGVFGFPVLPDAPQSGGAALIEVNDRRALNAVWRNNTLWASSTINPNSGPDLGQTTAHWWQIDTTNNPPNLVLIDQGDVGAEDLGVGTYTFFPTVMVDCLDNMAMGFSASNSSIFCGAYYAVHTIVEAPGTVRATGTLQAGTDFYQRVFPPDTRNRWGDYSGLALCPVDEATLWVYNEYACEQGTPGGTGLGRWCTKLGKFRLKASATAVVAAGVDFSLAQNYPNPFNPVTSIAFTLPSAQRVQLWIYDARGKLVKRLVDRTGAPGPNQVTWDGTNGSGAKVASGVYYYQLAAGDLQQTRKMVLLK